MSYGTKFREPVSDPPEQILESLNECTANFTARMARKHGVSCLAFQDWKGLPDLHQLP